MPIHQFTLLLRLAFALVLSLLALSAQAFEASGKLEIHYINVGQGGATLIVGPDGTRIFYDFGWINGNKDIVPYLREQLRLTPEDGLHYTIVSHRDQDHYMGYRAVIEAGFNVLVANYGSGSPKHASSTMRRQWLKPAEGTKAGEVRPIPVGQRIPLGDGAEALVVAANGVVMGSTGNSRAKDENDRSVVLLITYGGFDYILDGDLGSGPESCTKHQTKQRKLQPTVARVLLQQGLLTEEHGVDVMHVAHHGSESSTSAEYFNLLKPEVGVISVGAAPRNASFRHPREDVVDKVLIGASRPNCVTAPPVKYLLQTEHGLKGRSATGQTSTTGYAIGDIKIVTDGKKNYTISGTGRVHTGRNDLSKLPKPLILPFDEDLQTSVDTEVPAGE